MNEIISQSSGPVVPSPGIAISIRVATLSDWPAIDAMQKLHHKQLGFFPRAQMEGYLESRWVLLAEEPATRKVLGYCASRDRYLKRDELGVIYQLCVDPGVQRKFVGAALLQAVFERSPYGCRLYCCWCAQDIAANYFWESMGFVPLAFRAGSAKKSRVHIFWQKRILSGDSTTPYWFPAQTGSGAIREDRLVLPIPMGMRWNDPMPRVLPRQTEAEETISAQKVLPAPKRSPKSDSATVRQPVSLMALGGLRIGTSPQTETIRRAAQSMKPKREKVPRIVAKNDPRMIAAARELRDRWTEKLNSGEYQPQVAGKYDVCRLLPSGEPEAEIASQRFLAA